MNRRRAHGRCAFPPCSTRSVPFMLDGMRFDSPTTSQLAAQPLASHRRQRVIRLLAVAAITSTAGCGDSESAADADRTVTTPPVTTLTSAAGRRQQRPPTPSPRRLTRPPPPPSRRPNRRVPRRRSSMRAGRWRRPLGVAAYAAETPAEPPAVAGSAAVVSFWRDLRSRLGVFDALELPDELRAAPTDVPAVMRQADEHLARAEAGGRCRR